MSTTDRRPSTKVMPLSQAIRLGATMGPQYLGGLFGLDHASCALGGAYLAIGYTEEDCIHAPAEWQWAWSVITKRPTDGRKHTVVYCITTLNDNYSWTREQIADWVELEEVRLGLYPAADDPITATAEIKETAAHQPDAVAVQQQR